MSKQNFTIIIEPNEYGGYISRCFELPGCYNQGETVDETILSMREAIELTIEDMKAHNENKFFC
ncbi:MAG: type II toxin-antitoxin system HicB family antitoxin [Candidatus Zixiibacteriota bacterium]